VDIIINEHQERLLEKYMLPPEMRGRVKRVNDEKMKLEDYIESHGEFMVDITNGKTYLVQYLKALSELIGKKYAVCAPVRHDGTYGAFYVKPLETFRKKEKFATGTTQPTVPLKKNLYQQMGLNN